MIPYAGFLLHSGCAKLRDRMASVKRGQLTGDKVKETLRQALHGRADAVIAWIAPPTRVGHLSLNEFRRLMCLWR